MFKKWVSTPLPLLMYRPGILCISFNKVNTKVSNYSSKCGSPSKTKKCMLHISNSLLHEALYGGGIQPEMKNSAFALCDEN